jgi:hypothetical protein
MEKVSLQIFGILGIVIFVPLFLFTFVDPQLIEKSGKSFVQWKLQSATDKKIDSISLPEPTKFESLLGAKAIELRALTELKLEELKRQLKADAPALLAAQIAKLQDLDCECRKKWEASLRQSMQTKLASLEGAKSKLIDFSNAKYMEIAKNLTLDVRVFLGANSLVFLFLLFASFLKPLAVKHLFLPGSLMVVSTAVCSYFYMFEQNWFYTIIYNDYTGFGYVAYLFFVFAILCDIIFNRARVTTEFINGCLQAIGQVGSLVPC